MNELKYNGYIVQRKNKSLYRGVEGDNWYLNYCSNNPTFELFYSEFIDKAWNNLDYVDCCVDKSYIKKYIDESRKIGIEFRILLCSTCKNFPKIRKEEIEQERKKLGYDFADSGGSYYSCILNDIISGRVEEFKNITLNQNGLFNTYKEAEEFKKIRDSMINANKYTFEMGDFVIYKVEEIIC